MKEIVHNKNAKIDEGRLTAFMSYCNVSIHVQHVCTVCVLCVYCVTVRTVEGVRTRTTKEEKRHAVWLLAARFCVIRFCSPNVGHLWFCSLVVGVTMATFLVGSSGGTRRSFVSSDLVTSY